MSARVMLKRTGLTLALAANVALAMVTPAAQAQEYVRSVTQYSYDANGRLVCTAVRMTRSAFNAQSDACLQSQAGAADADRITKTEYDKLGRALQVRMAVGTSLEQAYSTSVYSDNGKVVDTIDAKGNRSHYVYDNYDRLKTWYLPNPSGPSSFNPANAATAVANAGGYNSSDFEDYDYDANDNRKDWRRRENPSVGVRMIGTIFDALNRPITKNVWASADMPSTSYSYAYDNLGRMTSAAEGGREIASVYDVQGLRSETTKLGGSVLWSVGYSYDAAGRRDTLQWPDTFNIKYGYDNASALKTLKRAATDTLITMAYDDLSRRQSISRGNGVTTSYGYDPDSLRLSSLSQSLPTAYAADNVAFTFGYNIAGQITRRTISNAGYVWQAQALDKPYASNGLNQIISVGDPITAPTITYDGRGNLKSDGSATYQYDLENRLRAQGSATLTYDPLGRLFETQTGTIPNVVTRYAYDGPNLIAEYSTGGTLLRRYVHGAGTDEPLVQYMDAGTTPEYLLGDHQGSIIAATGPSGAIATQTVGSTTVRKVLTYGEYGQPGLSNTGLFQYTGQIYLANLALYHYKARAYSPVYGRFLQVDPIGYDDGLNWYAYVGNDPLNKSDTTGLCATRECSEAMAQAQLGTWKDQLRDGAQAFAATVASSLSLPGAEISVETNYSGTTRGNAGVALGATLGIAATMVSPEKPAQANLAFKEFNQARNGAVGWLEQRGFQAEKATIGKFGNNAGKPIGMQTGNGKIGFRVEFDERHGAHLNVWSGREKATFTFNGDQSMVDQIVKQFIK